MSREPSGRNRLLGGRFCWARPRPSTTGVAGRSPDGLRLRDLIFPGLAPGAGIDSRSPP